MKYPEYAEVGGKRYKINTDYRVALRCFEVIDDNTICDEERALAIVYLLFGLLPETNLGEFLRIAGNYLRCGEAETATETAERDIDFIAVYTNTKKSEEMPTWRLLFLLAVAVCCLGTKITVII